MKYTLILGFLALVTVNGLADMTPVQAKATRVQGAVEFAAPGSDKYAPLKVGQILPPGSSVKTGADGVAFISPIPGTAIRVGKNSSVILSELGVAVAGGKVAQRKATIDLQQGTLSALIDKSNPQGTDFRIRTAQGVAAARGTFYAVNAQKGKSYVLVKEGKVGVKAKNIQ